MTLDLPDDQWILILLALRKAEHGHRVLKIADQTACGDLAKVIKFAIEDVAGMRKAVAPVYKVPTFRTQAQAGEREFNQFARARDIAQERATAVEMPEYPTPLTGTKKASWISRLLFGK